DTWRALTTLDAYDLRNAATAIEVPAVAGGDASTLFLVYAGDHNSRLGFEHRQGTVYAFSTIGGTRTNRATEPYNPNLHRWWRLREASGTVYWDTSGDGTTWQTLAQIATPFSVAAIQGYLQAGGGTASDIARFDNWNLVPDEPAEPGLLPLTEDFADALDPEVWDVAPANGQISVANGVLSITPNTGYPAITTVAAYDLRNKSVLVEVVTPSPVDAGNNETTGFAILRDANNAARFFHKGTLFRVQVLVGGSSTMYTIGTLDPTAQRWWRIRETGGTLFWETSPDSRTWTTQVQVSPPWSADAVHIELHAGLEGAAPPQPTIVQFDNLNLPQDKPPGQQIAPDGIALTPRLGEPTLVYGTPPPQAPRYLPFSDAFEDEQVDVEGYELSQADLITEFDGTLNIQLAAGSPPARTRQGYDRTRRATCIELVQAPPTSATNTQEAELWFGDPTNNNSHVRFVKAGPDLRALYRVGGAAYVLVRGAPYDPTEHRWLQLREQHDTLFWETSRDGHNWVVFAAAPSASIPYLRNGRVALRAGYYGAETNPGLARFDNWNLPPAVTVLRPDGIAPEAALGTPALAPGAATIAPAGIPTPTARLGAPALRTATTLTPSGIAPSVTLGAATLVAAVNRTPLQLVH